MVGVNAGQAARDRQRRGQDRQKQVGQGRCAEWAARRADGRRGRDAQMGQNSQDDRRARAADRLDTAEGGGAGAGTFGFARGSEGLPGTTPSMGRTWT